MSCGKVGGKGSGAEGEGAIDVDGVLYHAGQWYVVGWCPVR
jgi:predicted DNA-binding transcriptional regulator YafY